MLISCDKCGPDNEGKLDLSINEVICLRCRAKGDVTIVPITPFFKQMMKDRRDILDESDQIKLPPNGMLTTCENTKCAKSFSAEVKEEDDSVSCPYCKTKANISVIAKSMLKANGIFLGSTAKYFEQEGKEAVSIKADAANIAKAAAIAKAKTAVTAGEESIPEATEEELDTLGGLFQGPDPALIAKNAVRAAELGKAVLEKGKTSSAFQRADK